jgi:hypothetical protein
VPGAVFGAVDLGIEDDGECTGHEQAAHTLHGDFCIDENEPRRWLCFINGGLKSAAEKPQLSKFGAAQPETL